MTKMDEAKLDYLAGMKYKDIAEKYGVALSTVKSWKTRNGWQRTKKAKKSTRTKPKSMRTKIEKVARSRSPDILEELADNDELTDKQKAFCMYYLQRYNATWAYQKAYDVDYDTARAHGSRMVANGNIKQQLAKLKKQQSMDLYADANDILLKYLQQATADVTDVLEFKTIKKLKWSKVHDPEGDYEDDAGPYRLDPWIDPQTGEQGFYYESIIVLKDSSEIDTANIKSVRIDKGQPVVEMYDKQTAMRELLDRLPEPDNSVADDDGFIQAIEKAIPGIWSNADVEGMEDENNGEEKRTN